MIKMKEFSYKIRIKRTGEYFQTFNKNLNEPIFTELGVTIKKLSTIKKHLLMLEKFGILEDDLLVEEFETIKTERSFTTEDVFSL